LFGISFIEAYISAHHYCEDRGRGDVASLLVFDISGSVSTKILPLSIHWLTLGPFIFKALGITLGTLVLTVHNCHRRFFQTLKSFEGNRGHSSGGVGSDLFIAFHIKTVKRKLIDSIKRET
jgi:hypothetical protein